MEHTTTRCDHPTPDGPCPAPATHRATWRYHGTQPWPSYTNGCEAHARAALARAQARFASGRIEALAAIS